MMIGFSAIVRTNVTYTLNIYMFPLILLKMFISQLFYQ